MSKNSLSPLEALVVCLFGPIAMTIAGLIIWATSSVELIP